MKIVSFCLWGDVPKYTVGAVRNAELMRDVYPEWDMQVYYDPYTVPADILSQLRELEATLIPNPFPMWAGMLGRFLAAAYRGLSSFGGTCKSSTDLVSSVHLRAGCPDVKPVEMEALAFAARLAADAKLLSAKQEVCGEPEGSCKSGKPGPVPEAVLFRDTDSRISVREASAVWEWLKSDCIAHSIRDHPYHDIPLLGGMWGIKPALFEYSWDTALVLWADQHPNKYQIDQSFLSQVIWPLVKHSTMFHDELRGGNKIPIPRDGDHFIGESCDENDVPNLEHAAQLRQCLGL